MEGTLPMSRKAAKASDSRHYRTGKPCSRGHLALRLASTGQCLECTRVQCLAWYHRNSGSAKISSRKWKSENLSRVKEYESSWRKKNPDKVAHNKRRYRSNMTEAKILREKLLRRTYRDPAKARARWLKVKDSPKYRTAKCAREATRRARKASSVGAFNNEDVVRIRSAQKDRCAACRLRLNGAGHIDHIFPLSRGGLNAPRNIQILCAKCNRQKCARDPIEFMQSMGRLL